MNNSILEQLRSMTGVVADSGDVDAILRHQPQDATTNPSLIAKAAGMPRYQGLVDDVLRKAQVQLGSATTPELIATLAFRQLGVAFGNQILEVIPGRVSTEVDARLSFDQEATLEQARDIIRQYDQAGTSRERVLVKIAATWEGIQAARQLEREHIHCNLTLVFGIHQAVACAEAKVTLISPFVGRISDWFRRNTGHEYHGADDPGVRSVHTIYNYLKKYKYSTQVMGASFRNVEQICQLAGCDLLTIAPPLLAELDSLSGELPRMLSPAQAAASAIARIAMDRRTFEDMHRENEMASDQLTEGIDAFGAALAGLEKVLLERLAVLGHRSGTPLETEARPQ